MTCVTARRLVSARLDGDDAGSVLDDHLGSCADCVQFAEAGAEVRRALRLEEVGDVPDIAGAVRARLDSPPTRVRVRPHLRRSRRAAQVTSTRSVRRAAFAALLAGVLIGVNLVGLGDNAPRPVAASSLPGLVAGAQSAVGADRLR